MWNFITEWFGNKLEKKELVREFNFRASRAWDNGEAPTLLQARISWGNSQNKHSFSDVRSGFRIKAVTGVLLASEQCKVIGLLIMSDQELVRKLIRLGFDTLEVFGTGGGEYKIGLTNLLLT